MKRLQFIQALIGLPIILRAMKTSEFYEITSTYTPTPKMPVLFVGHGNPMNAILDNNFTQGWEKMAANLPVPRAILCVSAHWETRGTYVTAMDRPRTIHDFGRFPQALFDVQYPAPGSPEFARLTQQVVKSAEVGLDDQWGLDHGTWSVLAKMYPKADIPVYQLSLDYTQPPSYHYALAKELAFLRERGVLILGSGNIVHNLRMADLSGSAPAYDWALEFDQTAKELIEQGNHTALIDYAKLGVPAQLSIPTPEHYLPLLYALALQDSGEQVQFFNEEMAFRSGSMRSLLIA